MLPHKAFTACLACAQFKPLEFTYLESTEETQQEKCPSSATSLVYCILSVLLCRTAALKGKKAMWVAEVVILL